MGNALAGKKVVLAASRKTEEMATLIEKQGGTAIVRPLQGTVFLAEEQVEPELKQLIDDGTDWMIFTTGIGTETLLKIAQQNGLEEPFLHMVQEVKVAARGYKTLAALKKIDVKPIAKDDDGTTEGLSRALKDFDLTGKRVTIQLHGETAPRLTKFLEEKGAAVKHILPYRHIAPEPATVDALCEDIFAGKVDAVCFTTAIQVRSLFNYARVKGLYEKLIPYFKDKIVPVAVGKVTAEAFREEGIDKYVVPELERMGAMIIELGRYYESLKEV
ncbi:uroporphyrinogen-III synthase [Alkalihalobacterium chitinilyticum]|uniref:Uroporphyrinogen-III synthase n=1 Tax=Alkalihalobacterium chitinilyticum TaxID=2980103 RepID=A0ABT5VJC6_9BACI|nr:uroporphyrinogen-III synthase [Alkalihalobacterium chitinilyticum]MDE5415555.1 uroporphyrinogen-III synthase [Alkalihalobacterium chitinilyticum]